MLRFLEKHAWRHVRVMMSVWRRSTGRGVSFEYIIRGKAGYPCMSS